MNISILHNTSDSSKPENKLKIMHVPMIKYIFKMLVTPE